ncbi:MAG: transporter related protein [Actinomycetia bacterium]|nr:transporter related protein [Actinomycetes bacterium]
MTEPAIAATGTKAAPKLVLENIVKDFTGRRHKTVRAIDGIDIEVGDGEIVCLVGASGCGKTTLLNIVAGLEQPTSGGVTIDGEAIVGPGPDRGMVFQSYSLYPWRTVSENVAFGLECIGMSRKDRAERVQELLGIIGLGRFADNHPKELSGGMRQRVAIARALAPEPDILLLDEPFGALDAQTRRAMQEFLLLVWQRTRATILFVTHDIEEAILLATRIYVLSSHPGRVVEEITVPFGTNRGPSVLRDPRFLDLRDEIQELLTTQVER